MEKKIWGCQENYNLQEKPIPKQPSYTELKLAETSGIYPDGIDGIGISAIQHHNMHNARLQAMVLKKCLFLHLAGTHYILKE